MRKLLVALLGIVIVLLVVVVAGAFVGPRLIDLRPRVIAAVHAATGRDLRIDGDLHLALLPRLRVSASGIHFSNAPGAAAPEMVSADSVDLVAEVWPLLRGRFVIDSLVIRRPVVALEVDKSGRPNWAFQSPGTAGAPPARPAPAAGEGAAPANFAFGTVTIEQGRVSYRNDSTGQSLDAKDISLAAAMANPARPLALRARMTLNNEPVAADLSIDSLDKLHRALPAAVSLSLDAPRVKTHFAGTARLRPAAGLDGGFDLDIPSVGQLAAWLQQPLGAGRPDPGPLKVHAAFASDGAATVLKDAAITGKAIKATLQARFDGGKTPPAFDAKVDVQQADIDAYLPPPAATPSGGPAKAPAPPPTPAAGWSSEPFDLTALGAANGTLSVALRAVTYHGLELSRGDIQASLAGRVLKVAATRLALAQGTIDATATLDATQRAARLDAHTVVAGVQARPLLKALANSDRLGGTIAFENTVKGSGRTQKELVSSLAGAGMLRITNGAIYGINIAQTLRKAGTLGFGSSQAEKTDFAELGGTYTIRAGVIDNRDMKMLAPLFRITGAGTVPLPARTVDYAVEAKLVPTIQGQGGTDAMAGVPIPIRVTGPWSHIAYQIDWAGVFRGIAADPARLKALPGDLGKAAQGFGVTLPSAGGAAGTALPSVPSLPIPKSLFGK